MNASIQKTENLSFKDILKKIKHAFYIVLLIIIFICLLIQSIENLSLLNSGARTEGRVIESYEKKGRGKTHSYSIIEFRTAANTVQTFRTDYYYHLSEKLAVLYNPAMPSKAIVHSTKQVWLEPFGVLLFLIFTPLYLRYYMRNRKK